MHAYNVYTIMAAPQLVQSGNIDYLVADYLSEITMSLLTSAKHKSPVSTSLPNTLYVCKAVCTIMCVHIGAWYNTYFLSFFCVQRMGYCPDFIQTLKPLLKDIKNKGECMYAIQR